MSDESDDVTRVHAVNPVPPSDLSGIPTTSPNPASFASALDENAPSHSADLGRLGRYRILRQLGKGGMGIVYLGFDETLQRHVALKVLQGASSAARERFLREARAAAKIRSEHVVVIHDVDEAAGVPFIAMEYLEGLPLNLFLAEKPSLSLPLILHIARGVTAGLVAAHAAGLIHRDIKPGNIWLETVVSGRSSVVSQKQAITSSDLLSTDHLAPTTIRVKLLDFGLVKDVESEGEAMTRTGAILGTPAYMSPEQARGEPVDARTDLFSLGIVLYQLTTGQLPFKGPSVTAILTALAVDHPTTIRSLNPAVPEPLAELIHQLLAKKPADRPRSAVEVLERLNKLDGSHDASAAVKPTKSPRRWLAIAALLILGGVSAVLALADPFRKPSGPVAKPDEEKGNPQQPVVGRPAVMQPVADPERAIAEWVVSKGGWVGLHETVDWVSKREQLPPGPFRVRVISLVDTGYRVTDADLDRLIPLDSLTSFGTGSGEITDVGIEKWSKAPNADKYLSLNIYSSRVTDAGLAHLKRFRSLDHLQILSAKVSGEGLAVLRELPKLRTLVLESTPVTDTGLRHLHGLKLTGLVLRVSENITDAGLEHIRELPLSELNLQWCPKLTDAGMKTLGNITTLTGLDLYDDPITDAGLIPLANLKNLTRLNLSKTKVTAEGVAKLRSALLACKIESDFDAKP